MDKIITRAEAKDQGLRHYFTGVECKRGHVAKRLTSTKMCVECGKIHRKRWYDADPARAIRVQRNSDLKRFYGVTPEQFEAMREAQNNQCPLCLETFTATPHVDHCHKTGKVRGLLCSNCNTALGLLQDSPENILRAISYLEEAKRSAAGVHLA